MVTQFLRWVTWWNIIAGCGAAEEMLKTAKSAVEVSAHGRRGSCSGEISIGDIQQQSGFGEKNM